MVIGVCIKPLGWYIARVYENSKPGRLENIIYRLCNIHPEQEMSWRDYTRALLIFNALGLLAVFALQKLQYILPFNPQHFSAVATDLAFNTAAAYVTNTDWQNYSGENTLSYFTQMMGLTVQNFLSAATGMGILVALIRGLMRNETPYLGNFWVDTVRSTLYILLPLSIALSLALTSQGVIQNLKPYQTAHVLQPFNYTDTQTHQVVNITEQTLPMGPVASQLAIKQLGSNGGGFFNANSAHPFENPTPLTNFLEMLAILLIPTALCYAYGMMLKDKRQGWALLIAMTILTVPMMVLDVMAEQNGNPLIEKLGVDNTANIHYPGGNMEGKETRLGIVNSAMWAAATTATSNGSVNSMHDSFTPLGGFIPLWMMQLGEVAFGGVGSGLYNMILLVVITTFIAGLMIGRTPEYLGKKIEPFEMKMAALGILIMPMLVLVFSAIAVIIDAGKSAIGNPGAHGLTEILYAFSSMANNNGSEFSGLNSNNLFYNLSGSFAMLLGRFGVAIPVLAMAGSLARKKKIPATAGTLDTHTPLFVVLLLGIVILFGALTFSPALMLGPIIEHLEL